MILQDLESKQDGCLRLSAYLSRNKLMFFCLSVLSDTSYPCCWCFHLYFICNCKYLCLEVLLVPLLLGLTWNLEIYPGLLSFGVFEQGKSSLQVHCCTELYNPRLCKYRGWLSCRGDFQGNKHRVRIDTYYRFIQWSYMCFWKS